MILPANTTSLIQPRDQGTIRAVNAYYRREMRARNTAELDDIQDRSDASAAAKKISLLDVLHLVAMSWKRVLEKTIEHCFRKGGFSKTKAETPVSEEFDLTCEIFDQNPEGMSKEEFENWLDIDNNAEAVATMTGSEICEAVANDKSKSAEESEMNCASKEEDILEAPPTNA
jgi:hypothetical protein